MAACGPDPEPATGANPPPVASTVAPAPSPVATEAPPAEPTPEQHKANAKAAIDAKDWGKAKTELQAVVAKNPNDVEAQKMLGQVAEAQNDSAGATDAYLAAAKADGGKDEVLALAAAAGLYAQRRYDDLASLMQMTTKANAKSQPSWIYLALAQEGKEDWAGASETWTKLTQSWPDEPKLWAELAADQAAAGKADDAKRSAKTALDAWKAARDPKAKKDVTLGKGADEIATIARAYRRAGDPKAASAALDRYPVPKDETAPLIDVERGFVKLAQKDSKGAATLADKAGKAGGEGFAPAHLLAAGVAATSKKPDEAKTHLAAFDKLTRHPSRYAWERKWIDGLASGAPAEAPKAPAAPPKSGTAPAKQGGAGKK
jgi:Flp pilus assembly protein TadD